MGLTSKGRGGQKEGRKRGGDGKGGEDRGRDLPD